MREDEQLWFDERFNELYQGSLIEWRGEVPLDVPGAELIGVLLNVSGSRRIGRFT